MSNNEKSSIRLTRNDKYVLRRLIEHARISDSSAAKEIGVTPQAVLKIRKNLKKQELLKDIPQKLIIKSWV